MKIVPALTIAAILVSACSSEETVAVGFHTTNAAMMEALESELESRDIPFTVSPDGQIFVSGNYSTAFDEAKRVVGEIEGIDHPLSLLFTDKAASDSFKDVLESKSVSFTEFTAPVGDIVEWYPTRGSRLSDLRESLNSLEGRFSIVSTMPTNN